MKSFPFNLFFSFLFFSLFPRETSIFQFWEPGRDSSGLEYFFPPNSREKIGKGGRKKKEEESGVSLENDTTHDERNILGNIYQTLFSVVSNDTVSPRSNDTFHYRSME